MSVTLPPHSIFRKKEGVVCEQLGSEAVLLDLKTGDYFTVNATGRAVWNILDEEHNLQKVLEKAVQRLPASREQVEKDVPSFLEELCRLGLCLPQ